jgi:hypothetical protein
MLGSFLRRCRRVPQMGRDAADRPRDHRQLGKLGQPRLEDDRDRPFATLGRDFRSDPAGLGTFVPADRPAFNPQPRKCYRCIDRAARLQRTTNHGPTTTDISPSSVPHLT